MEGLRTEGGSVVRSKRNCTPKDYRVKRNSSEEKKKAGCIFTNFFCRKKGGSF